MSRSCRLRKEYDNWCCTNGWCDTSSERSRWTYATDTRTYFVSKASWGSSSCGISLSPKINALKQLKSQLITARDELIQQPGGAQHEYIGRTNRLIDRIAQIESITPTYLDGIANYDLSDASKIKELNGLRKMIDNLTAFQSYLVEGKMLIINCLNRVKGIGTFKKTDKGFEVVNPEGYVAIDKEGGAVKLVDRMEFAYNNFTAQKNWDK